MKHQNGKKGDLSVVVGARSAGLSILQTPDVLGFFPEQSPQGFTENTPVRHSSLV